MTICLVGNPEQQEHCFWEGFLLLWECCAVNTANEIPFTSIGM